MKHKVNQTSEFTNYKKLFKFPSTSSLALKGPQITKPCRKSFIEYDFVYVRSNIFCFVVWTLKLCLFDVYICEPLKGHLLPVRNSENDVLEAALLEHPCQEFPHCPRVINLMQQMRLWTDPITKLAFITIYTPKIYILKESSQDLYIVLTIQVYSQFYAPINFKINCRKTACENPPTENYTYIQLKSILLTPAPEIIFCLTYTPGKNS